MKRLRAVALLTTLIVAGVSCGGDPTGSGPGIVKVRLTSPNSGADSAIVITITGPAALTSAVPGSGLRLFQQPLGGTTTRFAVVGLGVSDVRALSQYSGTITGVAQPNYQLRVLPGGYALALTR